MWNQYPFGPHDRDILGSPVTFYTCRRQAHRVDSGVRTEFNALSVHAQQGDIVVVRLGAVPLVFDHFQHFEVNVFWFCVIAPVVFQESYADVFPFETIRNIVKKFVMSVIRRTELTSTRDRQENSRSCAATEPITFWHLRNE